VERLGDERGIDRRVVERDPLGVPREHPCARHVALEHGAHARQGFDGVDVLEPLDEERGELAGARCEIERGSAADPVQQLRRPR
jgi:hypothetical protein